MRIFNFVTISCFQSYKLFCKNASWDIKTEGAQIIRRPLQLNNTISAIVQSHISLPDHWDIRRRWS